MPIPQLFTRSSNGSKRRNGGGTKRNHAATFKHGAPWKSLHAHANRLSNIFIEMDSQLIIQNLVKYLVALRHEIRRRFGHEVHAHVVHHALTADVGSGWVRLPHHGIWHTETHIRLSAQCHAGRFDRCPVGNLWFLPFTLSLRIGIANIGCALLNIVNAL